MYRVITYRSIPLKKNTFSIDGYAATEDSVANFDAEKPKKKKKQKEEEKTYIIDGVEVREEDLTPDEKLDMEANAILNTDGFYDPLLPLDYYEEEEESSGNGKKVNKGAIAAIIGVTLLLVGGIIGAMIFLL